MMDEVATRQRDTTLAAIEETVQAQGRTLEEIVRRAPASTSELAAVPGIGPARLERYGAEVLAVLSAA
jgi:superfamily II DNA helicase RecQ